MEKNGGQENKRSKPSSSLERPYVLYNLAMTLDGKIGFPQGKISLSSPEDLKEVHQLRSTVDGIMVGIDTIIWDNPALTIRGISYKGPNPIPIVVDSNLRIPLGSKVFQLHSKVWIGCKHIPSQEKKKKLEQKGAEILCYPPDPQGRVPLAPFLQDLKKEGFQRILLEGGGKLGYSMLFEGLVDELRIAIAPYILGSQGGASFADGPMVSALEKGIGLKLIHGETKGNCYVLHYKVLRS